MRALSRRAFLQDAALTASAVGASFSAESVGAAEQAVKRPRVAAIFTELRFRSHAYNILENFIKPYLFNGKLVDPGVDVVSFYADQFPDRDLAREVSRRFQIPLFSSIDKAVCVGGKELAVDAVLSIGEHGVYPFNNLGQRMYPRKRFFDHAVAAMKRSNRYVPFFNDKHLSFRWEWAKEMYDTSRKHGFPLMAGSSVPLAQRRPAFELPAGADIEEAVSIHGGGVETYDFHGLEVLQSIVEARNGGESGISRIELLTGKKFQQAVAKGRWSQQLVEAAMTAENNMQARRQQRPDSKTRKTSRQNLFPDHALLVTYRDGFRATVLKVGRDSSRWNFACKLRGESKPRATAFFNGPWGNRCLFKALSHAIQHLFVHRKEPYPVERTLLVSGALEAAMQSHHRGGIPIETPHLEFPYQPIDFRDMREMGASWKIITEKTPQPANFEPGDAARFKKS